MREFKNEGAQCACCAPKEIDNVEITAAYRLGQTEANKNIIDKLLELGVLRRSMLGSNFYVIYSEYGPKDITIERLTEMENK